MKESQSGMLIVISGPAGSGKGTVVKLLREKYPELGLSVSATTRKPRAGEVDGEHYYFITKNEFEKKIEGGEILEHTVYHGEYYGTPKKAVADALASGKDIILEIEVQGAAQVSTLFPDCVAIMLVPPDFNTLVSRLEGRKSESKESEEYRLNRAKIEIACVSNYDYIVVNENDGADKCADKIAAIIEAERSRVSRNIAVIDNFFN